MRFSSNTTCQTRFLQAGIRLATRARRVNSVRKAHSRTDPDRPCVAPVHPGGSASRPAYQRAATACRDRLRRFPRAAAVPCVWRAPSRTKWARARARSARQVCFVSSTSRTTQLPSSQQTSFLCRQIQRGGGRDRMFALRVGHGRSEQGSQHLSVLPTGQRSARTRPNPVRCLRTWQGHRGRKAELLVRAWCLLSDCIRNLHLCSLSCDLVQQGLPARPVRSRQRQFNVQ
jgi:hypothetical protein